MFLRGVCMRTSSSVVDKYTLGRKQAPRGALERLMEGSGKRLGSVLGRLGSVLRASGERHEVVLERPGRVLGRLEAVLVAFKVVLDVKMRFESAQDTKS